MNNFNAARQETINYHEKYYSQHKLFEQGSWLAEPDPACLAIVKKMVQAGKALQILDIGCGVGRNAIALAQLLKETNSQIRCVDMLPLALEKLREYARWYGVENIVVPVLVDMDDLDIEPGCYDFILAVSCLEHSKDLEILWRTLTAIQRGTARGGYNRLSFSTDRQVVDAVSNLPITTLVETPLRGDILLEELTRRYSNWQNLKIETSVYSETLEYNGQPVCWSSKEISLVASRPG